MTQSRDNKPLQGRSILLAVTGGIACYKAADLTSKLVAAGADVNVAMTAAAAEFVRPLTFQALSHHDVSTGLFGDGPGDVSPHISLTERADLMIVAPATADIIGKFACGIADNLISTMFIAAGGACDILVAPSMNSRMWAAPSVRANIEKLKSWSVHFVGPAEGKLACGSVGIGRMVEPADILTATRKLLERY